ASAAHSASPAAAAPGREPDRGLSPVHRLLQLLAGDRALVPGNLPVAAHDHRALVALAGDEHHIASAGGSKGAGHRLAAVHLYLVAAARGAGLDLAYDLLRVLGVRILVGEHEEVGQAGRRRPHDRPFGPISLARA